MPFIFVYITNPDERHAKYVAEHLLKKKLIKCANYFPIKSSYWWNGKIANEKEYVLIVKAKKSNWSKIKNEVKKMHHYKIPCIIKIDAEANKEFGEWINSV